MLAQSPRHFRIGFERHHTPAFPHQPRRQQRKKSDVRSNIVKSHSGPQMQPQSFLYFRLTTTFKIIPPRPWI
jgi:hypothetical protein